MSDVRGVVGTTANVRVGSGQFRGFRLNSDGSLFVQDGVLGAALEGKLFGANFGSVTTPLATPATTAIAAKRPQAWIRVPSATAIVPVAVNVTVEATGATTQGEIVIALTSNDLGDGTSSAGPTPVNLNTAFSGGSGVTARQLATGDVTGEVGYAELKRFSFAASAVNQEFAWNANAVGVFPVLRGGTLALYVGGNAVNFFAQIHWVELPATSVS